MDAAASRKSPNSLNLVATFATVLLALLGLSAAANAQSASTSTLGGSPANTAAMYVPGLANVTPTGAFTYSIPILVPPGTAREVPSLSLNYSSTAGDGLEGMGWFLGGLSAITRYPRTLAQDSVHGSVNYDMNDRYCLNGQRLVLTSGTYGAEGSVYRTEIDTFTKVIAECDSSGACTSTNGPDWFLVQTRNGKVLQFGKTSDSRIATSATASSGNPTIAQWMENQEADLSGNYFNVTYATTSNYPRPSE